VKQVGGVVAKAYVLSGGVKRTPCNRGRGSKKSSFKRTYFMDGP